ncbi:MAG: bifunctional metallophosphatase/5'-nucleotidase [Bdellovibrionota bacterium]
MRQFVWILAAALLVSCSHGGDNGKGWGVAQPIVDQANGKYDEIVVVGTNDFHGYLRPTITSVGGEKVIQGGASWFAGYVDILQRKFGDHLVLLDAGDMYQGTMDSNMFKGKSVEDFYNLLPYRAVAIGNHEFDYGPLKKGGKDVRATIKLRMRESTHPFVQANIFYRKGGRPWTEKNLQPSVMVNAGGYKVGIIGLTTTHTAGTTLPQNVADLEFREFAPVALSEAQKLRARGADFVFITTHEGDGNKPSDPIAKMLASLPPGTVDAVVSGHSHTEAHLLVNGVPVIQSRTQGKYFGRIDFFVNKETHKIEPSLTHIYDMQPVCGTWFQNSNSCDAKVVNDKIIATKVKLSDVLPLRAPVYEGEAVKLSQSVEAVLAPYLAKADAERKEVLGEAKSDFERYPSGENQVGTLILDAFHDRFPQAKVVYMNGGGIRRMLTKGPITYGDLYETSPFDNFATLLKFTGKQLKELVKVHTSGAHGVPAVWGIKINYFNREDPAFDRDVNGDGKKEKWERDRLDPKTGVVWEKTGKPVGDKETFWLATVDYLAAGGDNTAHVFDQIPANKRKYFDVGPRDLMAEYLRKNPGIELPRTEEMKIHGIKGAGADTPYEH